MANTKALNVTKNWVLAAQNVSEIFVYKNQVEDLQVYIGSSLPSETTKDYINVESYDSFSISDLSGTDKVYIRTNGLSFTIKTLLV